MKLGTNQREDIMGAESRTELERELGGPIPELDGVSDDVCAELLAMFHDARALEKKTLDESIDAALGALPRIFRGPARKIMFGGK